MSPSAADSEPPNRRGVIALAGAVATAAILSVLVITGIINVLIAFVLFCVVIVGLLVFYGGGTEMASGLSDHEGFEQQVEEEEQRKAEEEGDESEGEH
jgi:hypothetical protein